MVAESKVFMHKNANFLCVPHMDDNSLKYLEREVQESLYIALHGIKFQLEEKPRNKEQESREPHLQPPQQDKQFLISPPASPPVGWEQVIESEPVINYDLISAMASLTPGQAHELHPPSETQPGIVVHICEDPVDYGKHKALKIPQTKCPERT